MTLYQPTLDFFWPQRKQVTQEITLLENEKKEAHLKALRIANNYAAEWLKNDHLAFIIAESSLGILSGVLAYMFENVPLKIVSSITSLFMSYNGFEDIKYSLKIKNKIKNLQNNLLRTQDDPNKENALALMPNEDDFSRDYVDSIASIAKIYNIDLFYPYSLETLNEYLNFKKYSHIHICGHGTPESIIFASYFSLTDENVGKLKFNLSQNATIDLDSCSTGAFGGIGEKICNVSNRKVFAPKKDVNKAIITTSGKKINYKFFRIYWLLDDNFQAPFYRDISRIILPEQ